MKTRTCSSLDLGLLLLRVMVGAVFVFHGSQKLFGAFGGHGIDGFAANLQSLGVPMPVFAAYLSGSHGVLRRTGVGPRDRRAPGEPAARLQHVRRLASPCTRASSTDRRAAWNIPLTLAMIALAFVLTGAGAFSIDAMLRERHARATPQGTSTVAHA
jgi:putative oxidoreductase